MTMASQMTMIPVKVNRDYSKGGKKTKPGNKSGK